MKRPTYLWRANSDGTVVRGLFDADDTLPEGWVDHPDKVTNEAKRKPGRPRKTAAETMTDGGSA